MRFLPFILLTLGFLPASPFTVQARTDITTISFDFCGSTIRFNIDKDRIGDPLTSYTQAAVESFCAGIETDNFDGAMKALKEYKEQHKPVDWLYYQLVRKTVQYISPKVADYYRYTIYKWYFMVRSDYDAMLTCSPDKILFYIRCNENIYNIPYRTKDEQQYVCLNYHDYGTINFLTNTFTELNTEGKGTRSFTYKVNRLPDFTPADYQEKELAFSYNESDYHFKVKLNKQIQTLFTNYPVVDYDAYLNIPLSQETYNSLIPVLKKKVKGLSTKNGVDYLMRFTRYAFLFQPDSLQFGGEKRLSPEQTLLYDHSDCEDRVALFFCLVKEIYHLPMIVLAYPKHVTIAVQFDKPAGRPVIYNGNKYSICEPSPQKEDLPIGSTLAALQKLPFEVVYAYNP